MVENNVDVNETLREFSETEAALEVERILKSFKLNPWEQLGVDIDISEDDLNKVYRKKSLLIHPDKCKHPEARLAFQLFSTAKKSVNEEGRKNVMKATIEDAKSMIIHQKKLIVNDPYFKTSNYETDLKKAVNKILLDVEWRKRQLERKITEEEGREKKKQEEMAEQKKRKVAAEKCWEDSRDTRVSEWRDFLTKDKKKKTKRLKKEADIKNSIAIKLAEWNKS